MRKLSKNQISLMNTVEDLIHSNEFKFIISKERVPFENDEINFGNWKFNDEIKKFNIGVPPQFYPNLDEKETLLIIDEQLRLTLFPSNNLLIQTNKEEFFNFLLYIIRQSRGF